MGNEREQQALEYLSRNLLHNIGMIFPIKRDTAEILYAADDGVVLIDTVSGAMMQSVDSYEVGVRLLEQMPDSGLTLIHQDFMLDDFKAKVCPEHALENFTAAYLSDVLLPTLPDMNVIELDVSYYDMITQNYELDLGEAYLRGRLEAGALYGAIVNGEMIGFAGEHAEGSLGMLVILEQYRRRGYAAGLVGYGVNKRIEQGLIPFTNVFPDNHASIEMHKKLGFTISKDKVWWLF